VCCFFLAQQVPRFLGTGSGGGWNGEDGSSRRDVSSFRLPSIGLDVFIGTLLGQASLHDVYRTDQFRQLNLSVEAGNYSEERAKPGK